MNNSDTTIKRLNKALSKYLFDLFITNTYALAFQMPDGKYVTKYLPVSEYLIEEMLNQKGSIGCYQQCYKSNMVKWICFDFDSPDKENPDLYSLYEYNVRPLTQICDEYHIKYMTEFSGRRGIHIWIIFSHLIPKEKAFQILSFLKKQLLLKIGEYKDANLDLFPATDSSKGNIVGKQVKLPLSVHKSGSQSWLFQGPFIEIEDNYEYFLESQLRILENYVPNDYEETLRNIGITDDDFIVKLKYKKYCIEGDLNLSISETLCILSETKVYSQIFNRLMQGKAFRQDWLVVMGTFAPLNDGGRFVKELYSIFPNYDAKKTTDNINKYRSQYYPATFEYLYKIYSIDIEESIDKTDTGFSYLLKKKGITLSKEDSNTFKIPKNEKEVLVEDTIRKEQKYLLDNDEVLNIAVWNSLKSFKRLDIFKLENEIKKIMNPEIDISRWEFNAIKYDRKETEEKTRVLVSLGAKDRVLTTHVVTLLQNKLKKNWNSYSYNMSICSREDIFYNWYSSWSEYLNKIKSFLEVPFMENYEVFVIDLKGFYDHVDFLSVYSRFMNEMDEEEKKLFRFLINYNDRLMRNLFDGRRKGVPQGPAYARIISEMYLDSVLSDAFSNYDKSIYHLYRYVDDIIVFVKPENKSNEMFVKVVSILTSFGLPINEDKSFWYGPIKSLNEKQIKKILRKNKFTYDLQDLDYKGFVTLLERKKDIEQYIKTHEFEVGDVSLFFSKKTYYEAGEIFFNRYASKVMESQIGRGSSFRRFYEFLFTNYSALSDALQSGLFEKVPLNSINFGNLLGELYLLVQEQRISQDLLSRIQNEYLTEIDSGYLTDEYQVLVESIKKLKMKADASYVEG